MFGRPLSTSTGSVRSLRGRRDGPRNRITITRSRCEGLPISSGAGDKYNAGSEPQYSDLQH